MIRTDSEVDQLEKELDDACYAVLALQQPTAIDLRFLVAVMKISTDLERMGDSAVNVAQAVEILNQEPPLKPYIDLPRLAIITQAVSLIVTVLIIGQQGYTGGVNGMTDLKTVLG